jgi:hypothetical protein
LTPWLDTTSPNTFRSDHDHHAAHAMCMALLSGRSFLSPLITQVHLKAVAAANASACDLDAL